MAQVGVPSVQSAAFADLLLESGLITRDDLAFARAAKARTGAHIDEVLVGQGRVAPRALRSVMAQAWGLPSLDLTTTRVDSAFIKRWPGQLMVAENWMPLRRQQDGSVLVATSRVPDAERREHIERTLGLPVTFGVATSWDIRQLVLQSYGSEIADDAANELFRQNPALSARELLSQGQRIGFITLLAATLFALMIWPGQVAIALLSLLGLTFLGGTLFKFFVALRGAALDLTADVTAEQLAALRDEDLPVYSVLIPLFREKDAVARVRATVDGIDWPASHLEVLVLVEEDDTATRSALTGAGFPGNVHLVTVPQGTPRTKSRACNVGLFVATGEFLVIYDGGDVPEPDQLKKAYLTFRHAGDETVCIQASLDYANAEQNALTRLQALENGAWFDYLLTGLDAADLPIPLGGTSNHFRTSALHELGGWDPYNVTEDADLGIRASAFGYRVGVVASTTTERADPTLGGFLRRRSRWVAGYLQTALVHARRPRQLISTLGLRRTASFALLVGGTPVTFLGMLPLAVVALVTLETPAPMLAQYVPVWLLWVCLIELIVGSSVLVYLSMMGPYRRGSFRLTPWALLTPLFGLLNSIAAYRGLVSLISGRALR